MIFRDEYIEILEDFLEDEQAKWTMMITKAGTEKHQMPQFDTSTYIGRLELVIWKRVFTNPMKYDNETYTARSEKRKKQCSEAGKRHNGNQYTRMAEKTQSQEAKIEAAKEDVKDCLEGIKTTILEVKEEEPKKEEAVSDVILPKKSEWLIDDFFTLFTDYLEYKGTREALRNDYISVYLDYDMYKVLDALENYASIYKQPGFYPEYKPEGISSFIKFKLFEELANRFNPNNFLKNGSKGVPREVYDRDGYKYSTHGDKHGHSRIYNRFYRLMSPGCPCCGDKSEKYYFDCSSQSGLCRNCGSSFSYEFKGDKIIHERYVQETDLEASKEYNGVLGFSFGKVTRISDGVVLSPQESFKIIQQAKKEYEKKTALLPPPKEIFEDKEKLAERYCLG